MKKLFIIFLIGFIFLSCKGFKPKSSPDESSPFGFTPFNMSLNQQEEGTYFLLPKDSMTVSLNTYENGQIIEQKIFYVTNKSIFGTNQKDIIAIIDTDDNAIVIYNIHTTKEIKLSIPFDITPKTILINDQNIFIGGMMGEAMLVQYHLINEQWFKFEVPEGIPYIRKAIDDLVINDNYLIAVDNLIIPKYILFYHLNSTGKLDYSHYREIKNNGTYEQIYQARISFKYLGIFSASFGRSGLYEHISIYNDLDLRNSFAISFRIDRTDDYWSNNYLTINDFIIVGDKLYIAHRINGLGILEIKESYFGVRRNEYDIFNREIEADNINYKQYVNEEVLRLALIPNENKMILMIRNSQGNIRHEIMEL
ncbi:MAG: hypothetical protein FWD47_03395 [Treponema sp.]|nr:hypothetical protein [Treponema sp.]